MTDHPPATAPSDHDPAPLQPRAVTTRRATLIGCAAILVTMVLHPTGRETLDAASHGGSNWLARGVHLLAIAGLPLLLAGMRALSHRLERVSAVAGIAWLAYLLSAFAVLVAAIASGLIAPSLADALPAATGVEREVIGGQFHYTGLVNQAFATIYVMLSSGAYLGWSLAMRRDALFPRALAAYGVIAGLVPLLGVLTGHLRLDVHGFGAVVVLQTTWMAWSSWCLTRRPQADGAP